MHKICPKCLILSTSLLNEFLHEVLPREDRCNFDILRVARVVKHRERDKFQAGKIGKRERDFDMWDMCVKP